MCKLVVAFIDSLEQGLDTLMCKNVFISNPGYVAIVYNKLSMLVTKPIAVFCMYIIILLHTMYIYQSMIPCMLFIKIIILCLLNVAMSDIATAF